MKYKNYMPKGVKRMAEYHLRYYESNLRELARYRRDMIPSATPPYSAGGGGSHEGQNRPAERVALDMATDRYIFQLEQSTAAVEEVYSRASADDRKIVEHVYWKHDKTVSGAAMALNMDASTAYEHINNMLYEIAILLGYVLRPK